MQKSTFFVVPGNGEALLGMLDIELLNILSINCSTIGTDKEEIDTNCNMRIDSIFIAGSEQCCANTGLERSVLRQTATEAATQTVAVIQI